MTGVGSIGPGAAEPHGDRRDFDLDVDASLSGRLFYRDWSVVRDDGTTGTVTVSPTDAETRITAFRDSSQRCEAPTRGVEFDGIGRLDFGALFTFTVVACDNGPAASGADEFRIEVPDRGYSAGIDRLSSGDLAKSGSS